VVLFSRNSLVGAGLLAALSVALTGLSPGASATFCNVKAGSSLDVVYCTMNNPA
jgi:hypothetical protein